MSARRSGVLPFAVLATLLVLVAGIAVCRLQALTSDWAWDTGAWMYMSRRILEGGKPYVDVWDNKLPPIFWIGVVYLKTGFPRVAMYLTELGLTAWIALVLAALARRAGVATSWSFVLGGLFVCASMPVWEYPHRLETYALAAVAPGAWLLVTCILGEGGRGLARAFLAGVLLALAAATRPQHGLDAVLLGGWLLVFGEKLRVKRFAAYVGGGIAFTAALSLVAWARGYLGPMVHDAVFGSLDYASAEQTERYTSLGAMAWELRGNVLATPLVWLAFGGGGVLTLAAWRSMGAPRRALAVLATTLFLSQFLCTFLAGHQLGHYHFPLGWSAALLLAVGCSAVDLRVPAEVAARAWLAPLALALLFATTAFPDADVYQGVQDLVRRRRESKVDRLETLVRDNVPRAEPLYLLDDYSMAGVLSRLPNPAHDRWILFALQCSFFDPANPPEGTTPYGVTSDERGRHFRPHLEGSPPPWLVRQTDIEDELSPFVRRHYDEVATNGEFTVFRLRE